MRGIILGFSLACSRWRVYSSGMNNTKSLIGSMTRQEFVAHLNKVVREENARRGRFPLPYHGLPAGTLPLGKAGKVYRYSQGDVELTVYENGFEVYYAPVGTHTEFLPTHGDDAFAYAAEKKNHLSVVKNGGIYANSYR